MKAGHCLILVVTSESFDGQTIGRGGHSECDVRHAGNPFVFAAISTPM